LFILAVPLPAILAVMVYLWADARSARKAAEADKIAAIEARDRADRDRELAQGYLHSALGTMEKIVDRVGDGPLSRMPQAQEERTAVLNDAVTFYESLLRLDSTDPTVRFETAQAYHRVSRLVALAGRIDESVAASRAAIRLLTDLVNEHPDRPAYRDELARVNMFQGHGRLLNADYDGAIAAYRQSIDVADALARDVPHEPGYRATLAECHRSLGYYFMATSPAESERHFREALRLADGVYAERPNATSRALLASVLGAYGQFQVINRRSADAEKLLDRGAALTDPKAGPPPAGGHARLNFDQAELTIRYALGLVYAMTGRAEQGEKLAREAVREYETLLASQPRAFPYRVQTLQAQSLLARLAGANKRPADAAKACGRAIELIDDVLRDYPAFRDPAKGGWLQQMRQGLLANQALSALDAGMADAAARTAAELNPDWPGLAGGNAYNIACVFARLAGGVTDGSVRDEYAAKAMTWLKKAAATGYPSTPEQVEHIRTKDDDLKALRDRPEFREWAKTLKPAKGK
jgi:tetratricopeptide (TPR) repeat protein